jgi:hypothetical protein
MERVIDHHFESKWNFGLYGYYKFWRYNRDKYVQWVTTRHVEPTPDIWDQYILRTMNPGHTVVYDSQALIWKRLHSNVTIIENDAPAIVEPLVTILSPEIDASLTGTVSNLILYRPLSCKLCSSMVNYLTTEQFTRSGRTPNLKNWLAPNAKIFWSVGQEFFAFNRLKETLLDFIKREAKVLSEQYGIELKVQIYNPRDYVNGQVKMIFQLQS